MPYDRAAVLVIAIMQIVESTSDPTELKFRLEQYMRDDLADLVRQVAADLRSDDGDA